MSSDIPLKHGHRSSRRTGMASHPLGHISEHVGPASRERTYSPSSRSFVENATNLISVVYHESRDPVSRSENPGPRHPSPPILSASPFGDRPLMGSPITRPPSQRDSRVMLEGHNRPDRKTVHRSPNTRDGIHIQRKMTMDQCTGFWDVYGRTADVEDREFVKLSGDDLDVLLIFAGLFAGINTAFIIESYKLLSENSGDRTNQLLQSVLLTLRDPSYIDPQTTDPTPFAPNVQNLSVNFFFFASLCCSLSAAFGAVLGKQWLANYEREGSPKTPADQGRQRQEKFDRREIWRLGRIVEALPTLLQVALFLFLGGLVLFLWPLNIPLALLVTGFTGLTFLFYILTLTLAAIDPNTPFQTRNPFPHAVRAIFGWLFKTIAGRMWTSLRRSGSSIYRGWTTGAWSSTNNGTSPKQFGNVIGELFSSMFWLFCYPLYVVGAYIIENLLLPLYLPILAYTSLRAYLGEVASLDTQVDARCVTYLLKRTTLPNSLEVLSEAADALEDLETAENVIPIVEALVDFHFEPSFDLEQEEFTFGIATSPSSRWLIKILHILLVKWNFLEKHGDQVPVLAVRHVDLEDRAAAHPERDGEDFIQIQGDLAESFVVAIEEELLKVFWKLTRDQETIGRIADIWWKVRDVNRDRGGNIPGDTLKKFIKLLEDPSIVDVRLKLLYLKLLALAIDNLALGGPLKFSAVVQAWQDIIVSDRIRLALQDSMWLPNLDNGSVVPDLDYQSGELRIQLLILKFGSLRANEVEARKFSKYLVAWFGHWHKVELEECDAVMRSRKNRPPMDHLYVRALWELLADTPNMQARCQQLTDDGHLDCLLSLLRLDFVVDDGIILAGLDCFLTLWHHQRSRHDELGYKNSYLSPTWVMAIVDIPASLTSVQIAQSIQADFLAVPVLGVTHNIAEQQVAGRTVAMMERLALYLRAAGQQGLLTRSMEGVVGAYMRWGDQLDKANRDPSSRQCRAFYSTVQKLVFVDEPDLELVDLGHRGNGSGKRK